MVLALRGKGAVIWCQHKDEFPYIAGAAWHLFRERVVHAPHTAAERHLQGIGVRIPPCIMLFLFALPAL